jgi:hypothetical protein
MPRKKGGGRKTGRRLQIKIRRIETPAGLTGKKYIAGLKRAVRTGELPEGWAVDVAWRNPDTKVGVSKDWQEGDFESVLSESSSGFKTAMMNILNRVGQ